MWRFTTGEVMTSDVLAVNERASFTTIARILTEHHVNAVAVLDHDCRVIGIVSEGDLLCKAEKASIDEEPSPFLETRRQRAAHAKAAAVAARGLMSTPAVTIAAKTPAVEAAQVLAQGRFRQLPVVDGEGRLVGMITRADVIRALAAADYAASAN